MSDILNHQILSVPDEIALIRFIPLSNSSASLLHKKIEKPIPEKDQSSNLLPC
jgi:hypothetical protein